MSHDMDIILMVLMSKIPFGEGENWKLMEVL